MCPEASQCLMYIQTCIKQPRKREIEYGLRQLFAALDKCKIRGKWNYWIFLSQLLRTDGCLIQVNTKSGSTVHVG